MAKSKTSGVQFKIVLLLIIIVAAAFFYFGSLKKNSPTPATNIETVQVDGVGTVADKEPFSGLGTLTSLQAMQQDIECQIVYSKEGQKDTEGTYFVSEGKIRGDFIVSAVELGGDIVSSLILDGQKLYVWSKIDNETFGFVSDRAGEKKIDGNEPVPLDVDVKYSCTEWTNVDRSIFVPPTNVEFKDLNNIINTGMEYGIPN
jgi:hypothetical protein